MTPTIDHTFADDGETTKGSHLMAKAPTVRTEIIAFLGEWAAALDKDGLITTPIPELADAWDAWRIKHKLPAVSMGERNFRQALARMESLGLLEVARRGRDIVSLRLSEPPAPSAVERIRSLERERAMLSGRFVRGSKDLGKDLVAMRTPAINAYVRRRRDVEAAMAAYRKIGDAPAALRDQIDPLGEEALALKERVLRNEVELIAWRALGAEHGLSVESVGVDLSLLSSSVDAERNSEGLAGRSIKDITSASPKRKAQPAEVAKAR